MKCPKCGGTGEMQICEMGFIGKDECDKCHGKGYLNNEEWLHTMNAEQLAEFLVMIQMSVMHPVKRGAVDMEKFIEEVVEWLRQPHKEDDEQAI